MLFLASSVCFSSYLRAEDTDQERERVAVKIQAYIDQGYADDNRKGCGSVDGIVVCISSDADAALPKIAALPDHERALIRRLILDDPHITEEGAKAIAALDQLSNLSIENMWKDDWCKYLVGMKQLKTLWLNDASLTGECFEHISKLRSLDYLNGDNNEFKSGTLKPLANLTNLTGLAIGCKNNGDDDFAFLEHLPKLRSLNLADTSITDKTLECIQSQDLDLLVVVRTKVTEAGIEKLQQRIKSLKLVSFGGETTPEQVLREPKADAIP